MAEQQSLSEVVDARRQHDLPGEEHLRSDTQIPDEKPESAKSEPVKGEKKQDAPPAATEKKSAKTADEDEDDADPHPVPRKALIAERRKRQEAERLAAETRGQLLAYQQQLERQAQAAQQPKTEDPDAAFYGNPTQFIGSRVDQAVAQVQQQMHGMRLGMSEAIMRRQHEDYDETVNAFVEVARNSPMVLAQFQQSEFPAEFAYTYGKSIKAARGAGSMDELVEKVRAEERQKLEDEYRKKGALASAEQASISSATARGSGASSSGQWNGPAPLKSIIPGLGI